MLFRHMSNPRGMTMVEVMVVCMILSMTLLGTLAVFMGSLDYWQKGVSSSAAASSAGIALQKMVREIEEGSSASASGDELSVDFATYNTSDDYYDRASIDHTTVYYLSGTAGTETTGTRENLWKRIGTTRTLLLRGVDTIAFSVTGDDIVTITLTGKGEEGREQNTSPSVTTKVRLRN